MTISLKEFALIVKDYFEKEGQPFYINDVLQDLEIDPINKHEYHWMIFDPLYINHYFTFDPVTERYFLNNSVPLHTEYFYGAAFKSEFSYMIKSVSSIYQSDLLIIGGSNRQEFEVNANVLIRRYLLRDN